MNTLFSLIPILLIGLVLAVIVVAVLVVLILRRARRAAQQERTPPPAEEKKALLDLSALSPALDLRTSFTRAVAFLKTSVAGRDYRYQVPWFMVIGEAASGKTTMLDSTGLSLSLHDKGMDFGLRHGLQWRFFDRGIVIDVAGDYVLRENGVTSNGHFWNVVIRLLQKHRARRPIDGIVLTVPCTNLMGPQSRDQSAVAARAARIREKLIEAQKILGLSIPVYVLITKTDMVRGFQSFCQALPDDAKNEIFGWSSPYNLEAAFAPAWVDEAFDSMADDLYRVQSEVFVARHGLRDADHVFLFPREFETLRSSMRWFLDELFRQTAYRESFRFRGLYFCGDSSGVEELKPLEPQPEVSTALAVAGDKALAPYLMEPVPAELPLAVDPVVLPLRSIPFLKDLFEKKIFAETGIARPFARVFLTRNRMILAAQITSVVLAFIIGIGLWLSYRRLDSDRQSIIPLLQRIAVDLHAHSEPGHAQGRAYNLLSTMGSMSTHGFNSIFFPDSLFSSINHEIEEAMVPAFRHEVLASSKNELQDRSISLSKEAVTSDLTAITNNPIFSLETTPPMLELRKFVTKLRDLQDNIDRYDRLRKQGFSSSGDLRELVRYLDGRELPEHFDSNIYFSKALEQATWHAYQFTPADRDGFTRQFADLLSNIYAGWFEASPALHQIEDLKARVTALEQQQIQDYTGLKGLSDSLGRTTAVLAAPEYSWIADRNFDPGVLVQKVAQEPLKGSRFLPAEWPTMAEEQGKSALAVFRTKVTNEQTRLSGDLLEFREPTVALAPPMNSLKVAVENVLNLRFMAFEPTHTLQTDLSRGGTRLMWNKSLLTDATQLYTSYERFLSEGLRTAPPNLAPIFRKVALSRADLNMLDLIAQAQEFQPRSGTAQPDLEADIYPEARNLSDCIGPLSLLIDDFRQAGLTTSQERLLRLVSDHALYLVGMVDQEFTDEGLYSVAGGNFDWWKGENPVSAGAFEIHSVDDAAGYLGYQRETIQTMSSAIEPLVSFLAVKAPGRLQSRGNVVLKWQRIALELKRFDAKKPGTTVATLEDFIRTDMDKIRPETGCQGGSGREFTGQPLDFFLQTRNELRRSLNDRCLKLANSTVYRDYTEAASYFNKNLAGHFPFGGVEGATNEADPAAIQAFFHVLDNSPKPLLEQLKASMQFGTSRAAGIAFLNQMETVRAALGAFLAPKDPDPVPGFDFTPHFRVNQTMEVGGNQIIDWTLQVGPDSFRFGQTEHAGRWRFSDPVKLVLRWAKDSTVVPANDGRHHDAQLQPRLATFEYRDQWALLTMLTRHRPKPADFERLTDEKPYTLKFMLDTKRDYTVPPEKQAAAQEAQVFVQIAVTAPGKKDPMTLPVFPAAAPTLEQER